MYSGNRGDGRGRGKDETITTNKKPSLAIIVSSLNHSNYSIVQNNMIWQNWVPVVCIFGVAIVLAAVGVKIRVQRRKNLIKKLEARTKKFSKWGMKPNNDIIT